MTAVSAATTCIGADGLDFALTLLVRWRAAAAAAFVILQTM